MTGWYQKYIVSHTTHTLEWFIACRPVLAMIYMYRYIKLKDTKSTSKFAQVAVMGSCSI